MPTRKSLNGTIMSPLIRVLSERLRWQRGEQKSVARRGITTLAAIFALTLGAYGDRAQAAASPDDAYAAKLGALINDYRAQHQLQALALVAPLSTLARAHATQMARQDRLSHEGFQQRFAQARSPHCVENVGATSGAAQAEFEAWRNSPVHDRNLLDPRIRRMGLAIEGRYVTFFACY